MTGGAYPMHCDIIHFPTAGVLMNGAARNGGNETRPTAGALGSVSIFELFEAIVDSDAFTAEQKCILVKVRCRVDGKTYSGAFVSAAGLMRAASLKDPRALRAELRGLQGKMRELPEDRDKNGRPLKDPIDKGRAILVIEERSGKASTISFTPERLQAIVTAYLQRKERMRGPGRPSISEKPPASDAGGLPGKPPAPHAGGQPKKPPASDAENPLRPTHPDPYPISGRKTLSGADAPKRVDTDEGEEGAPAPRTGTSWKPTAAEIEAGFEEWWQHYPRKEDRLAARKAYAKCVTAKDPAVRATIPQLLAAVRECSWPRERRFTKLPATWLNAGSWMHVSVAPASTPATRPPDLDDRSGRLHQALETRVGVAVYGSWFTTVCVESIDGDRLTVSAASPFLQRRIEQEYRDALAEAATMAFGSPVRWVAVTVRRTSP